MNLLLLDIDGVLNSEAWFNRREKMRAWAKAQEKLQQDHEDWVDGTILHKFWQLDPYACNVLQTAVNVLDCKVVVSSIWRWQRKKELERVLSKRGFKHPLHHRTPDIGGKIFWEKAPARSEFIRGMEIEHWILTHVPPDEWDDLSIVILDDESDMGRLMPWLVQTNTKLGLCEAHLSMMHKKLLKPLGDLLREPNPLWTDEAREKLYP